METTDTKKYTYRSAWDWFAPTLMGAMALFLGILTYIDYSPAILFINIMCMALVIFPFLGVRYEIQGDTLTVYNLFKPSHYPIAKMARIEPTRTILAAPAISLKHRIAISFVDRSVTKSTTPLIISPVRQAEFIARLKAVNPDIQVI